jgi:hypothetical protein
MIPESRREAFITFSFRISVQCDFGDTDLKRSLDLFLRGISYRKGFFAVIFDSLVQLLDQ